MQAFAVTSLTASSFLLEGQQPPLCLAEQEELRKLLPEMVRFEPTWEELELYKDGGVAIIDQWICAHARCLSALLWKGFILLSGSLLPLFSAVGARGCGPLPSPLCLFAFRSCNTQGFLALLRTVGLDPFLLSARERCTAQAAWPPWYVCAPNVHMQGCLGPEACVSLLGRT